MATLDTTSFGHTEISCSNNKQNLFYVSEALFYVVKLEIYIYILPVLRAKSRTT